MKRIDGLFFSLLLLIGTMSNIAWGNPTSFNGNSLSLTLIKFSVPDTEHEPEPDTHPRRHRSNRLPLYGTIDRNGIDIPGLDPSDILSFEISTPEGFCMGAYVTEEDFIAALFSLSGEYELRFSTEEAVYIGVVEI